MATPQQTPVTNPMQAPWTNSPIPKYVRTELERRATYGITFPSGINDQTKYSDKYRGPQSAWIRICSNAKVHYTNSETKNETKIINGFVFSRGDVDFYKNYGISNNVGNMNPNKNQIIGYERNGNPIVIPTIAVPDQIQKYRPAPSIDSLEVIIKKDIYRTTRIHWKCFSITQLEQMIPFFCSPFISVSVEWGWNNFSSDSLINLNNPQDYFIDPYTKDGYNLQMGEDGIYPSGSSTKIPFGVQSAYSCPELFEWGSKYSGGNYDGLIGKIVNWGYSYDEATNAFTCMTEVASDSKFCNAMFTSALTISQKSSKDSTKTDVVGLQEFYDKYFFPTLSNPNLNESIATENFKKAFSLINPTNGINPQDVHCVFSGKEYINSVNGSDLISFFTQLGGGKFPPIIGTGNIDKKYVSLRLFINSINNFISVIQKNKSTGNIDSFRKIICDVIIGGHVNMISWDSDILIPNRYAPFYYPESLISDEATTSSDKNVPQIPTGNYNDKNYSDFHLKQLLKSVVRQDLNAVINYKSEGINALAFPDPLQLNSGNLQNIYVSLEFIKDVCSEDTIEKLVDKICNKLNNLFPNMWKLERFNTATNVVIKDNNHFEMGGLQKAKAAAGLLSINDYYLYYFDPFSQESILKSFKFSVDLKDSIASQILGQFQNESGINSPAKINTPSTPLTDYSRVDMGENTVSSVSSVSGPTIPLVQSISLPFTIRNAFIKTPDYNVSDIINDNLIKIKVPTQDVSGPIQAPNKSVETWKNISSNVLGFYTEDGGIKKMSLLTFPPDYNKTSIALIDPPVSLPDRKFVYTSDSINTAVMPGVTVEFTLLGLGGFKVFQTLAVKNLPEPYKNRVVFQIIEIRHQIQDNDWSTTIVCCVRPIQDIDFVFSSPTLSSG